MKSRRQFLVDLACGGSALVGAAGVGWWIASGGRLAPDRSPAPQEPVPVAATPPALTIDKPEGEPCLVDPCQKCVVEPPRTVRDPALTKDPFQNGPDRPLAGRVAH